MDGRRAFLTGLALFALAHAGCGSKPAGASTVVGRVWYHGEPLPGGMIVFVPDEERGNTGPLVKSEIQSDGTFALDGFTGPGWYRMAIAPPLSAGSSAPTVSVLYPTVPSRYRNPQLSGLEGEVKPSGENEFEFVLRDG